MLIKRYPNRKLYNTQTKKYISLDELAGLIRSGEEIHVLDHTSGEDLTDMTLTQILFEQVKKQAGFLPRTLLSGLIQAGGDRLSALQRVIFQSVGLAGHVNTEIRRRLQTLVSQGEISEQEASILRERLLAMEKDEPTLDMGTEDVVEQMIAERGLASRSEIQDLLEKIDSLTARIEEMEPREEPPPDPAA